MQRQWDAADHTVDFTEKFLDFKSLFFHNLRSEVQHLLKTGLYLKVKQMCSACVCWRTIPWGAMVQRDVQKVMLEAFPSDATGYQSKCPRRGNDLRHTWLGFTGAGDAGMEVLGAFVLEGRPWKCFADKESAQWRERHARMSHVRKLQDVETETQLCNYFVYLANLGREIQLLPWKVGKSSVEKATVTQCCSELWRKLHRCRFQSEIMAK